MIAVPLRWLWVKLSLFPRALACRAHVYFCGGHGRKTDKNGMVYASCMSNVESGGSNSQWPNEAQVIIVNSLNTGENGEMEWDSNNYRVVSDVNSFWPALFTGDGQVYVEYQLNSECYMNSVPVST